MQFLLLLVCILLQLIQFELKGTTQLLFYIWQTCGVHQQQSTYPIKQGDSGIFFHQRDHNYCRETSRSTQQGDRFSVLDSEGFKPVEVEFSNNSKNQQGIRDARQNFLLSKFLVQFQIIFHGNQTHTSIPRKDTVNKNKNHTTPGLERFRKNILWKVFKGNLPLLSDMSEGEAQIPIKKISQREGQSWCSG